MPKNGFVALSRTENWNKQCTLRMNRNDRANWWNHFISQVDYSFCYRLHHHSHKSWLIILIPIGNPFTLKSLKFAVDAQLPPRYTPYNFTFQTVRLMCMCVFRSVCQLDSRMSEILRAHLYLKWICTISSAIEIHVVHRPKSMENMKTIMMTIRISLKTHNS